MANFDFTPPSDFNKAINMLESSDKNSNIVFNELIQKLINNDAYINDNIGYLTKYRIWDINKWKDIKDAPTGSYRISSSLINSIASMPAGDKSGNHYLIKTAFSNEEFYILINPNSRTVYTGFLYGATLTWQSIPKFTNISKSISFTSKTDNFYTGLTITIPAKKFFSISARAVWNNSAPSLVSINTNTTNKNAVVASGLTGQAMATCSWSGYTGDSDLPLYIWAKYTGATSNSAAVSGFYVSI